MTKSNTKRALVASVLSIVVCLSMLVGSTFAWFTDSVSVVGNKIQSGTLDIELWRNYYGSEYDNTNEVNITDSTDPIFNSDLWEPGYLAFANLTVKNVGTLAAKIKANLVPVGEVGKLAEVIDVYVVKYPLSNDPYSAWGTPSSFTVRDLIEGFEFEPPIPGMGTDYYSKLVTHVGTLKEVFEGGLDLMPEQIIAAGKDEDGVWNHYQINIALKMQETAGNEYQNQTAGDFDIRILATQATVEEDYFDNQYDKDAVYPVTSAAEAAEAMANAAPGSIVVVDSGVTGEIVVPSTASDITVVFEGESVDKITLSDGATDITFIGADISAENASDRLIQLSGNHGTLTLKNIELSGIANVKNGHAVSGGNGTTLVVDNCTISDIGYGVQDTFSGFESLTITNTTFENTVSWAILNQGATKSVTIDNCTFVNCQAGIAKLTGMQANGSFTFTNNTMTGCKEHDPYGLFQMNNKDTCTFVWSGNTFDNADFANPFVTEN